MRKNEKEPFEHLRNKLNLPVLNWIASLSFVTNCVQSQEITIIPEELHSTFFLKNKNCKLAYAHISSGIGSG